MNVIIVTPDVWPDDEVDRRLDIGKSEGSKKVEYDGRAVVMSDQQDHAAK